MASTMAPLGASSGRTCLVYAAGGLCGSLLSCLATPGPSVGASGAIFGLAAAMIVFLHKHQKIFFLRDKRIGFVLITWSIYTIACGFLTPYVDNYAHIGGFIGGIIGFYLLRDRKVRS